MIPVILTTPWFGQHTAVWLTALGTLVLAGAAVTALVGLRSLRDARRTRHAELLADLSRRWDEPLAAESRLISGEYDSRALLDLLGRIYDPPSWLTDGERRRDSETYLNLLAALNLMETIAALWAERTLGAGVIFRLWGTTFVEVWDRWFPAIEYMRTWEEDPGVYDNFENLVRVMRRRVRWAKTRYRFHRWMWVRRVVLRRR